MVSCQTSHGIHNDALKYRHNKMIKQDKAMKKAMQKARKRSSRSNFYKSKKNKKPRRFI